MRAIQLSVTAALLLAAGVCAADGDIFRGFNGQLANCTELIGFGPVPYAQAAALVPASYVVPEIAPGSAGLVVRASRCEAISIDGSPAVTGVVSQIGIAVVSPDGTGDINNYSLRYVTNDTLLAIALRAAGLPAQFDAGLTYEFTPQPGGQSGELYVAVAPTEASAYFLSGTASPPPANSAAPVVANWWYRGASGVVKVSTAIPGIAYGTAAFTAYTSRFSAFGELIGGNTDSNFVFLNARGLFDSGALQVTTQ